MPFKSEKQKKWMYANKPDMAAEWSAKEKLPKKKKKKKKKYSDEEKMRAVERISG